MKIQRLRKTNNKYMKSEEQLIKERKRDLKKYGGWWERKCKKCGITDFDNEGLTAGFGGGRNGALIHTSEKKDVKDCRGLVKETWSTEVISQLDAIDLLRSVLQVVLRKGEDTNWEALEKRIREVANF